MTINGWKRELAKWQLTRRYRKYLALLDEFSCGASLAEYVSPRVLEAKNALNESIRACRELDSTCNVKEL